MSIGLGPRIGWVDIQKSANQSYQDGLVHLSFAVTGKFSVAGAAGVEVREFEHDIAPEKVTPIVEGNATYQPFDSMTISLAGNRHRIVSSGLGGDDYTATLADLSIRQRFFQVAYLNLAAVYEDDQYNGVGAAAGGLVREDEITLLRAGIEWHSFRGIVVEASYQFLQDHSNLAIFSFDESRATVSATFNY